MARSANSIQAEIDNIEAHLAASTSVASAVGSRSTSITYAQRRELEQRLDKLYQQLGRANGTAPMLARGIVKGLR